METSLIVPAPVFQDHQFTKPLMCGPGPCDVWPSVSKALSGPVVSPLCDAMYNAMDDIRAGIQYVFQTQSKLVLAISGSGHSAMEAVLTNLVAPGETLLIAARGIWDERAFVIATRYDIKPVMTRAKDVTFSLDELESTLRQLRPAALYITHGDSSTGTVQNLIGIGELCHEYGTLLLVDTVVSLGGEPFLMDQWGIDGVFASTQKALSGPAGISAVAFSARAEKKINNRKREPPFYFDIKLLAAQWNCYGNTRKYHHTVSSPLLWALRCCLQEVASETLPRCWERHAATTARFHQRLQQFGFQFLIPKPEDRLVTVTTVVLPKGYDYAEFVKHMQAKHNILSTVGLGPTAGKALRIGMMGVNSTTDSADRVTEAMADTLRTLTRSSL